MVRGSGRERFGCEAKVGDGRLDAVNTGLGSRVPPVPVTALGGSRYACPRFQLRQGWFLRFLSSASRYAPARAT